MADTTDFLLAAAEENWAQARQSEDQRAVISNLVVVIASVIHGVLTQTGFTKSALPLTILLLLLGIYGIIASAKLYERHQYHTHRAYKIRLRLEELHPDAHVSQALNLAGEEHRPKYPFLSQKIRLNRVWLGLHALIMTLGIIYTLIILVR